MGRNDPWCFNLSTWKPDPKPSYKKKNFVHSFISTFFDPKRGFHHNRRPRPGKRIFPLPQRPDSAEKRIPSTPLLRQKSRNHRLSQRQAAVVGKKARKGFQLLSCTFDHSFQSLHPLGQFRLIPKAIRQATHDGTDAPDIPVLARWCINLSTWKPDPKPAP